MKRNGICNLQLLLLFFCDVHREVFGLGLISSKLPHRRLKFSKLPNNLRPFKGDRAHRDIDSPSPLKQFIVGIKKGGTHLLSPLVLFATSLYLRLVNFSTSNSQRALIVAFCFQIVFVNVLAYFVKKNVYRNHKQNGHEIGVSAYSKPSSTLLGNFNDSGFRDSRKVNPPDINQIKNFRFKATVDIIIIFGMIVGKYHRQAVYYMVSSILSFMRSAQVAINVFNTHTIADNKKQILPHVDKKIREIQEYEDDSGGVAHQRIKKDLNSSVFEVSLSDSMQEYSRVAILNVKKEKTQVNNIYSAINRSQLNICGKN